MRRTTLLAALGAALAASLATSPAPASAAVSSASIDGQTATLNLDGAHDDVTVSVVNGLLAHGQTTGGLNSATDWDSATGGDQTVPADGTFGVDVNGGDGNDAITVLAKDTEIGAAKLNGDGGDDVLTGADSGDSLHGGDGTDFIDGEAGNDATELNGNSTLGDAFTLEPNGGRVKFRRTNLVGFTLDASTEGERRRGACRAHAAVRRRRHRQ
jgi:hypothetical protein